MLKEIFLLFIVLIAALFMLGMGNSPKLGTGFTTMPQNHWVQNTPLKSNLRRTTSPRNIGQNARHIQISPSVTERIYDKQTGAVSNPARIMINDA
jgi:hypothetical protein